MKHIRVDERAVKEAQKEFRYAWPWFNSAWNEHRVRLGMTDMGDMPLEPFETFLETYLRKAGK